MLDTRTVLVVGGAPTKEARRHKDMTGQRFGRLLVVSIAATQKGKHRQYLCRCDCGNTKEIAGNNLRSGRVVSCGCYNKECSSTRFRKHGETHTKTHEVWKGMRQRCNNPKSRLYPYYGGRGITICERWNEYANFLADMGSRPEGHSIDRINNNGNYEPESCRWATDQAQARNRRSTVLLTHEGEALSLSEWAERKGIGRGVIRKRLQRGWGLAEAINTPGSQKSVSGQERHDK